MNPYQHLAAEYARMAREGRSYPLGGFDPCPRPSLSAEAPRVVICSPHPDDEVVVGGLALRLLRESGWRVVNVAVTQGSRKDRQAERLEELRRCCDWIGFEVVTTVPGGLDQVRRATREQDPARWDAAVRVMSGILERQRPAVVMFPHEADWNSTHVGVHWLVRDALTRLGPAFGCVTVETEFWGAMATPNLMVEMSAVDLGDLMTALTFHVGEVRRNPYHLTLPAWMVDNVRRGAELVGGQGGASPDFTFATLYRVRRWGGGSWEPGWTGGRMLAGAEAAGDFFGRLVV